MQRGGRGGAGGGGGLVSGFELGSPRAGRVHRGPKAPFGAQASAELHAHRSTLHAWAAPRNFARPPEPRYLPFPPPPLLPQSRPPSAFSASPVPSLHYSPRASSPHPPTPLALALPRQPTPSSNLPPPARLGSPTRPPITPYDPSLSPNFLISRIPPSSLPPPSSRLFPFRPVPLLLPLSKSPWPPPTLTARHAPLACPGGPATSGQHGARWSSVERSRRATRFGGCAICGKRKNDKK